MKSKDSDAIIIGKRLNVGSSYVSLQSFINLQESLHIYQSNLNCTGYQYLLSNSSQFKELQTKHENVSVHMTKDKFSLHGKRFAVLKAMPEYQSIVERLATRVVTLPELNSDDKDNFLFKINLTLSEKAPGCSLLYEDDNWLVAASSAENGKHGCEVLSLIIKTTRIHIKRAITKFAEWMKFYTSLHERKREIPYFYYSEEPSEFIISGLAQDVNSLEEEVTAITTELQSEVHEYDTEVVFDPNLEQKKYLIKSKRLRDAISSEMTKYNSEISWPESINDGTILKYRPAKLLPPECLHHWNTTITDTFSKTLNVGLHYISIPIAADVVEDVDTELSLNDVYAQCPQGEVTLTHGVVLIVGDPSYVSDIYMRIQRFVNYIESSITVMEIKVNNSNHLSVLSTVAFKKEFCELHKGVDIVLASTSVILTGTRRSLYKASADLRGKLGQVALIQLDQLQKDMIEILSKPNNIININKCLQRNNYQSIVYTDGDCLMLVGINETIALESSETLQKEVKVTKVMLQAEINDLKPCQKFIIELMKCSMDIVGMEYDDIGSVVVIKGLCTEVLRIKKKLIDYLDKLKICQVEFTLKDHIAHCVDRMGLDNLKNDLLVSFKFHLLDIQLFMKPEDLSTILVRCTNLVLEDITKHMNNLGAKLSVRQFDLRQTGLAKFFQNEGREFTDDIGFRNKSYIEITSYDQFETS